MRSNNDETSINELLLEIWLAKFRILFTTIVFALISVLISLSLSNKYTSEVLLAPANDDSNSLSSLNSQLGSIASISGLSFGGEGSNQVSIAIEVMKSHDFFNYIMDKYNFMLPLMAAKEWDQVSNTIILDSKKYDSSSNKWVRKVNPPLKSKPSIQEAHKDFLKHITISNDKKNGFVRIKIEHLSPHIAKAWMDMIIFEINETIRNKDKKEIQTSIDFLQNQIQLTRLSEVKSALNNLLEKQIESMMLAEASSEYIFKIIDSAIVSQFKSSPPRALICMLGTILGFITSIFFVVGAFFYRLQKIESL